MELNEFISRLESRILSTDVDYPNVTNLCYEAKEYGIPVVTVFPAMIDMCRSVIKDAPVAVCALISYPHGGMTPAQKADECADAEAHGAKEMEIAGNTRETKSMNRDYLVSEMRQIKAAVAPDTVVKYIIEIEMLSDAEAVLVCEAAAEAGIDWIVTSTGEYCTLDENKNDLMLVPTAHEVNLIRKTVGSRVKVQAEGNIVCARTAIELINAGADRISTPCPAKLIREFKLLEEQ